VREQLSEVVKYLGPNFEKIKVTGNAETTKIEGIDKDKMLFVLASLKDAIPDFDGEFGIGNLGILSGLLNFPSYKAEDSQLLVHRSRDAEYVAEFEFRAKNGGGARFRTMNPRLVEQPRVNNITWDVSVTPTKAAVAEFRQLAGLLSDVDKHFGVKVEGGTLFVTIGGGGAGTHSASVAFATDLDKDFHTTAQYNTQHLLSILQGAGSHPALVRFSAKGVAGVVVTTEIATYNYILRGKQG
jgi:hypothetical protein